MSAISEEHWSEIARDRLAELTRLQADHAELEKKYNALLLRWADACCDVTVYRDQLRRLGAFD